MMTLKILSKKQEFLMAKYKNKQMFTFQVSQISMQLGNLSITEDKSEKRRMRNK